MTNAGLWLVIVISEVAEMSSRRVAAKESQPCHELLCRVYSLLNLRVYRPGHLTRRLLLATLFVDEEGEKIL